MSCTAKHLLFQKIHLHQPNCLTLTIFQFNRCIVGKSAIMISLLTERFCPCRRCSPIALITKEQRHKKNGQRRLIFEDFSVLLLTFCQLNCCCRPQLATWDIYAHRQDITTPLMPLPRIAIYKAAMQKEW